MMRIGEALRRATDMLQPTSPTARLDAELLMAHALATTRSELLLRHMDAPVPDAFAALAERRMAHEPVAHILGRQEFYGLPLRVSKDVLIPRRDSEVLVENALAAKPDARRVLDCGTGSGALLLAVLHTLPGAHGIGIDSSADTLEIARENAATLGLDSRVTFAEADWDAPGWETALDPPFDLVLANPPYVETTASLPPSVRDFEPHEALFAGPEGLDAYAVLIPQLPGLLTQKGVALVEIGATQANAVTALADNAGLAAQLHRDLEDRPRVLQLWVKR